jgi:hypothetical protein
VQKHALELGLHAAEGAAHQQRHELVHSMAGHIEWLASQQLLLADLVSRISPPKRLLGNWANTEPEYGVEEMKLLVRQLMLACTHCGPGYFSSTVLKYCA